MCCFFLCFFFKQKTAYEMRISDWSSDVCSSDLAGALLSLRADVPGVRRFAARRCVIGDDLRFAEHLLNQPPRLALRPIQGKATLFVTGQVTLPGERRIFTCQRVGKQYDEIGRAHV